MSVPKNYDGNNLEVLSDSENGTHVIVKNVPRNLVSGTSSHPMKQWHCRIYPQIVPSNLEMFLMPDN